ncbi:MaoC family dehydratase N-terminal domain-containing protein [Nocardia sp. BMG111209]|uniref:FAS1-like dehydratase domain-containing protein n=1 Tax=Nocardia sp. BMG111209 TaxID=1160137 RepID=UPI0012DCCBD9|nr:MaoC family dehydratase N-terminal domain-containing protein [Nocardia sp. BMG111209]
MVERNEVLLPGPAQALAGLLGVTEPQAELPLLWHWIYLLDRPAQADLGPDGHPFRNTVPAPPDPGRRRMWAGGQVTTHGPLRLGEAATRRTEVLKVEDKQGRSGPLTFLTVGHRITQGDRLVVEERQDIVYREAVAGPPPEQAEPAPDLPPEDGEWVIDTSPTLLFRYSALTYNGHRIHYDRDYARDVEGYPGLLVHGPLQAVAMAESARARGASGNLVFDYRLRSPLFDHQGLIINHVENAGETTIFARDRSGRRTATATLRRTE